MTILVIPTTGSLIAGQQIAPNAIWTQTSTLEGVTYFLTFQWNQRVAAWYMSVADSANVDIYNGVKLICGVGLLKKCADPRAPPGVLLVLSATSDNSPPGLSDLLPGSGRCTLFYITSDWAALMATPAKVATKADGTTYTIPSGIDQIRAILQSETQTGTASNYGQTIPSGTS